VTSGPSATPDRPNFAFPKSSRLLRKADFNRVYESGSRVPSQWFSLVFAARPDGPGGPRVGFSIPRAVGNAVVRNRIRRRMREAIRLELPGFQAPVDMVFHPRRNVLTAGFPALREEVRKVFRRCGNS